LDARRDDAAFSFLSLARIAWAKIRANEDDSYARVRIPQGACRINRFGRCSVALADVSRNLADARRALDVQMLLPLPRALATIECGAVAIDWQVARPPDRDRRPSRSRTPSLGSTGPPYAPPQQRLAEVMAAAEAAGAGDGTGLRIAPERMIIYLFSIVAGCYGPSVAPLMRFGMAVARMKPCTGMYPLRTSPSFRALAQIALRSWCGLAAIWRAAGGAIVLSGGVGGRGTGRCPPCRVPDSAKLASSARTRLEDAFFAGTI